jgi:transcriptional regulator with XRE-family HTH domain
MIIHNTRELGGFVRQARENASLTQANLAANLGVRRQRVLYLERGEGQLQLPFVFAVLKALGIELSLAFTSEATSARRPRRQGAGEARAYSIDDIADDGVD